MKIRLLTVLAGSCILSAVAAWQLIPTAIGDENEPHWSYEGETGPDHWHELSPDWEIAQNGQRQSPIDLTDAETAALGSLEFHYPPARLSQENIVHTLKVYYDSDSHVIVGGERYNLVQFHFHTPSEHTIEGERFPMEMHIVHIKNDSDDLQLLVVGVMMREGEANPEIQALWDEMPTSEGYAESDQFIDLNRLLPHQTGSFYHYDGSLTTPPCTENVAWYVMSEPIELSIEQIELFQNIFIMNARPLQPRHGRSIRLSQSSGKDAWASY